MKARHITLITMCALVAAFILHSSLFNNPKRVSEPPLGATRITATVNKTEAEKRVATRTFQIRELLQEHDPRIRDELFNGFLYSLAPDEFASVFAALTTQLHRQRSYEYNQLMAVWSERDPHGALEALRPMFHYTTPASWNRSWEEKFLPPENLKLLAASKFWPTSGFLHSFLSGLETAAISETEKVDLETQFWTLCRIHLQEEPPTATDADSNRDFVWPSDGKDFAQGFDIALRMRNADTTELDSLLEKASAGGHSAAYTLGLRRVVQHNPSRAPEALEMAQKEVETNLRTIYPGASSLTLHAAAHHLMDTMTDGVFSEWVKVQPEVAVKWSEENSWSSAELAAQLTIAQRAKIEGSFVVMGRDDPSTALQQALDIGGEQLFGEVAEDLFTRSLDFRRVGNILTDFPARLDGYEAGVIIDKWILWDTAGGSRFGAEWLLNAGDDYPKDKILSAWRGDSDPADNTIEELTFGGLRCWALAQPTEMQSWIDTQQDHEVREALQWLHDHPNGP